MSAPMTLPATTAGTVAARAGARLAVLVATLLVRMRPARLAAVLRLLAARAHPADTAAADRAHSLVVAVSPYCAGWHGCLPRSVAICLLCRAAGSWPTWSAGVRAAPPFSAHAWVEAAGRLVGEPGGVDDLRPLLRVPAGWTR